MQSWLFMGGAILFEVAGTVSMKLSEGFSRLMPSVLIFIFYGLAFILLTLALKKIDVGVAYAVWSGVGTALVAIIGFLFLKESMSLIKILFITLIIAGVAGLYLTNTAH
jgi:small multidrug resistance pump